MSQYAGTIADYLISLPFPALLIVKSTIVLILAAIAAFVLHRSAASMRYAVWALALAATVVLPIGMITTPPWTVGIPKAPEIVNNQSIEPVDQFPPSSNSTRLVAPPAPQSIRIDLSNQDKLLIVWLVGTLLQHAG